jgi:hypothetical protein
MTTTYTPDPTTYAWSESDRQYGRPRMDRPHYMAAPAPVIPPSDSAPLRKGAIAAALLTAVVGGALLGTFVLGNSTSSPGPSVYMVPETTGPATPPVPVAAPPAPSGPTTVVVPNRAPAPVVIVPPANRGPVPAAVPAPRPAAPKPANVPPPPPPAPVAPPQVRIEGIPIPIPLPVQIPADQGQNNQGQDQQGQDLQGGKKPQDQGQDECTMVPDLPYCQNQGGTSGGSTAPGGTAPTGGAGGTAPSTGQFDPAKQKGETAPGDDQLSIPGTTDPAIDPDAILPQPPCILGVCP